MAQGIAFGSSVASVSNDMAMAGSQRVEGVIWNDEELATAENFATQIVEGVPGLFGKLAFLSSLRDISGEYRHSAFPQAVSPQITSQVLRAKHEEIFWKWLDNHLEQQWKELVEYLDTTEQPAAGSPGLPKQSWDCLIPDCATLATRQLFLSDLQLVTGVIESQTHDSILKAV